MYKQDLLTFSVFSYGNYKTGIVY